MSGTPSPRSRSVSPDDDVGPELSAPAHYATGGPRRAESQDHTDLSGDLLLGVYGVVLNRRRDLASGSTAAVGELGVEESSHRP
jgi:hypothetical protein